MGEEEARALLATEVGKFDDKHPVEGGYCAIKAAVAAIQAAYSAGKQDGYQDGHEAASE